MRKYHKQIFRKRLLPGAPKSERFALIGLIKCRNHRLDVRKHFSNSFFDMRLQLRFQDFSVLLGLLLTCCLGCFCVYKFCRSSVERFMPRNEHNQYDDGGVQYNDYQNGQNSYPLNSYPPPPQPNTYVPPHQYPQQTYSSYPPPQQGYNSGYGQKY